MHTLELHHRAHGPGLLHGHLLYQADKLLAWAQLGRIAIGTGLQDADELPNSRDHAPLDRHRLHQIRAARKRDGALQSTGIDHY
jgi:hypothetical protein